MHNYVVETPLRLDIFLSGICESKITRSFSQKIIENGYVKVNSIVVLKPSYKLKSGDTVTVCNYEDLSKINIEPMNIPLDIVYEDNYLIVINKKKGMLTHPTLYDTRNTLVNALLYHCDRLSQIGSPLRPGIVHRLDKDTAGLMVAAKTDEAHQNLSNQIRHKTAVRKYLSFVYGIIENDAGTIDKPLIHYMDKNVKMKIAPDDRIGKNAVTHYKVIKRYNDATLVELMLETGRTHQIRVHMASINHPVINDELYGAKGYRHGRLNNIKTNGHILMSYYLCFKHPKSLEEMQFCLNQLEYDSDFIKVQNFLSQNKV